MINAERKNLRRIPLRSITRKLLIQFLYQREIYPAKVGNGIEDFISQSRSKRCDRKFLRSLAKNILEQKVVLDPIIRKLLRPTWKWERLSPIVKSILRAGACEMRPSDVNAVGDSAAPKDTVTGDTVPEDAVPGDTSDAVTEDNGDAAPRNIVPGPIIIDQYVGLARIFCDDPEIAMINAVLQRYMDDNSASS